MSSVSSNVLIVYSSRSGATESLARRMGSDIIAYGGRPKVVDVEDVPVIDDTVDAVIFGSSMRVGKWGRDGVDWLRLNIDNFSSIPIAVFSVGLLAASDNPARVQQAQTDHEHAIASINGLKPVASAIFPGWKDLEKSTGVERLALKVYPLEEGDYRDWDAVDRWIRDIAPLLVRERA